MRIHHPKHNMAHLLSYECGTHLDVDYNFCSCGAILKYTIGVNFDNMYIVCFKLCIAVNPVKTLISFITMQLLYCKKTFWLFSYVSNSEITYSVTYI